TGQTGNQCILPGMEVVKKRDVCLDNPDTEQCALVSSISSHYTYTDILNITDSESAIEGVPLTFLYAIENRAPAIGFVPEQKFPADTEYFLTFIARDPDEDTLTYTLDEDYDELSYAYTADQDGNGVFTDEGGASSGDYSLKIRVTDDEGLFDEQEFNLKIED
ncbi:hypothetical protein HYU13_04960, partial [Candidatus Woesearchaeota archaeon]|nr:hypothetical protein [Candidatus Woesearchaeota archaeon]